jgi:hypothetical protein
VISHLVLLKPRPDLSDVDRDRLLAAFETAVRQIPSVRGVRLGRRVKVGAAYDVQMPDSADYFVLIDFSDQDGLAAYLNHPAHAELGARFAHALAAGLVYDFEILRGVEELRRLLEASGDRI